MATRSEAGQLGTAELLNALRQAILAGELSPGQRLVEGELSVRFGASRGTVRQALVLLENEGLAAREANRGAWVRPVSKDEALEITEVRGVLEGLCAARAATVATAEERRELKAIGNALQQAVRGGDVIGYGRISDELHNRIREISRLRTASDVLNRLRYQHVRYQFSVTLLPGRPAVGLKEHLALIKAICAGQATLADSLMREHMSSLADAIKQLPEPIPALPTGM
jgi:DNA-binding GntR family transcriptional regulator